MPKAPKENPNPIYIYHTPQSFGLLVAELARQGIVADIVAGGNNSVYTRKEITINIFEEFGHEV